jgi:hypothetical protein
LPNSTSTRRFRERPDFRARASCVMPLATRSSRIRLPTEQRIRSHSWIRWGSDWSRALGTLK